MQIPIDTCDYQTTNANNYVVSESYILDGIEFGCDSELSDYGGRVLEAQRRRYSNTGQLTAVTEDNLDAPPYFIYNTVYSNGVNFAAITDDFLKNSTQNITESNSTAKFLEILRDAFMMISGNTATGISVSDRLIKEQKLLKREILQKEKESSDLIHGSLILTLDANYIPEPQFLKRVLPYFFSYNQFIVLTFVGIIWSLIRFIMGTLPDPAIYLLNGGWAIYNICLLSVVAKAAVRQPKEESTSKS